MGLKLEVDGHPFSLKGREYERAILRDESQNIVIPKGAQLGLTTTFVIKSAHSVIQRGWQVLYLLPLKAGSIQFVQGRIDPILDSNAELAGAFSRTDNRSQKQTKKGTNWYIRGTNIQTELREVPADILVLDERDVANEENLDDAFARLDGSAVGRVYELSTPTVDGHGVYSDSGYPASDQMRWWVECYHCEAKQIIDWEANVLPFLGETIYDCMESCRCTHCGRHWTDEQRAAMNESGTWVPDYPGRDKRGYHLSQFNSPTKPLADPERGILTNWFKGQVDARKLKAFYNLGLGQAYSAPGDKFSVELLDACRRDYVMGGIPDGPVFIGIDVGHDILYVTIRTVHPNRPLQQRLWKILTITPQGGDSKWTILKRDVLDAIGSWVCVCDAHPDKEEVEALSKEYSGRFWMGFEKDRPDQEATAKFFEAKWQEPAKVNIDRTMAFDSYIKSHLDGNQSLPRDARDLGEHMPGKAYNGYYHHHLMMTRVEQADASERLIARWVNGKIQNEGQRNTKITAKAGNRPDHWHHSGMFSFVASMTDAPLVIPADLGAAFAAAGGLIGG